MIGYAASYGRMRALKGNLLSESDFQKLIDAPSTNEILISLSDMGYDGLLDKQESLSSNEVEHTLKQDLIESHIKLFSFLGNSDLLKLADLLMQRFELTNLKTILRVLDNSSSAQTAAAFILKLEKFHSLPIDDLLATQSIEECVEVLGNTPFGEGSRRAYEVYSSDQNLFSMEVALELDYYNRLTENLNIFADKSLLEIIGIEIDAKCIAWALRFRHHYKFEPEKIFQYMVADRWNFSDSLFWNLVSPEDIEDAASALSSSSYREILDSIDLSNDNIIDRIEILLQRDLYQKARAWFFNHPLKMSVLLAYFSLKRAEIHDLTTIIYGKLLDMPKERIERYLIITA